MVTLDVGRVCMKVVGKEAGKYCVVVKKENKSFVLVSGPKMLTGVKRRKANVTHLEPTKYTLEIKENAGEEEVLTAFEKSRLITKFNLKRPSAARVKNENEIQKKAEAEKKPASVDEKKKSKENKPKESKEKGK